MPERKLELTITKLNDEEFALHISEPGTAESTLIRPLCYSPREHPEFDDIIGCELYCWISELMGK